MKNKETSTLKKLRPAWLLFLAIPALYFFMRNEASEPPAGKHQDYLYFSVHTSSPSSVTLLAGSDSLASWEIGSAGYRYCDYAGNINDSAGLTIKIKGLHANDTLSILSINLFRNHRVHTLTVDEAYLCAFENASRIKNGDALEALVTGPQQSVKLSPPEIRHWEQAGGQRAHDLLVAVMFLVTFILVIIIAPPGRHFIFSCLISLMMMMLFYYVTRDFNTNITISNTEKSGYAEVFYNNKPWADPVKSASVSGTSETNDVPVNLEINPYCRFDARENSGNLNEAGIRLSAGMFFRDLETDEKSAGKYLLNDMGWKNGRLIPTGADPFVAFNTVAAYDRVQWLLFLQHKLFLFLTLLLLIALTVVIRFLPFPRTTRLKPVYLLFLAIPATFYWLIGYFPDKQPAQSGSILFFSVRSNSPADISLLRGSQKLASWRIDKPGYQSLEYCKPINENDRLALLVENLHAGDTFALLSMNLFLNNRVVSLCKPSNPVNGITNLQRTNSADIAAGIVQESGTPVVINLPVFYPQPFMRPLNMIHLLVIVLFLLCFVLLILRAPPAKTAVMIMVFTMFTMAVTQWLGRDPSFVVSVKSKNTLTGLEVFYNATPHFVPNNVAKYYGSNQMLRTEAYISYAHFLRFDITSHAQDISDLEFAIKSGILRWKFSLTSIPPQKLVLNDIMIHDRKLKVSGPDPFIGLTSDYSQQKIKLLILARSVVFLIITMAIFILLIVLSKPLSRLKNQNFLLTAAFLFFISAPLLLWPFHPERMIFPTEKRFATPRPVFMPDSLSLYKSHLNTYLEDQLPGRKMMITGNNLFKYTVYGKYDNRFVHFGKNGWMFFTRGYVKSFYENKQPLTPGEMQRLKEIFETRRDWLQQQGIRFYMAFPYMTQTVYPEMIGPGLYQYQKPGKLDQLLVYLRNHSDLEIIDVGTPIVEAKAWAGTNLYYRDDPHWNLIGAHFAYKAIVDRIRKDFPSMEEPVALTEMRWHKFKTFYMQGYLNMLSLSPYISGDYYLPFHKSFRAATDTVKKHFPEYRATEPDHHQLNRNSNGPALLMFHDSFGTPLMSYFAYHFSRCSYFWNPVFLPSVIEKEKPDIVIWEIGEANLYNILNANEPLKLPADSLKANPDR